MLFNADPTVYTTSFTTGENTYLWGGRSFVHPNVSNVIYPAVRAVAAGLHAVRPGAPVDILRRRVAYLVCPLASAATIATLFVLFVELDLGIAGASLLALLYLASFSALVFGSIPESYCLSALAFAILFLVATRAARVLGTAPELHDTPPPARWPVWVAIGTVASSITISNIVPFACVAFVVRGLRASLRGALGWSTAVSAAALAITAAGYGVGALAVRDAPPFRPGVTGQVREEHPFDAETWLVGFPAALANTVIPPAPLKVPADPALHQAMPFSLTFHARVDELPGQWWRALLTVALLAVALVRVRFLARWQQAVIAAAVLVIAFNWVLHTFYGSELFLYSQHWVVPLFVVFAALVGEAGRTTRVARTLAAALVVIATWNSVHVWGRVIRLLSGPT